MGIGSGIPKCYAHSSLKPSFSSSLRLPLVPCRLGRHPGVGGVVSKAPRDKHTPRRPKDGLSAARVPFRVVQLCDDANALVDGLRELAPYARHPRDALLLAAAISKVAIAAIGPDLWGGFFKDKA